MEKMNEILTNLINSIYDTQFVEIHTGSFYFSLSSSTHNFILNLRDSSCSLSTKKNRWIYAPYSVIINFDNIELHLQEGGEVICNDIVVRRISLKELVFKAEEHFCIYAYPVKMKTSLGKNLFIN